MRVFYRAIRNRLLVGPRRIYEQAGPILFCCREMIDQWGILVGFGVLGCRRTTSREVNIFTALVPQTNGRIVTGITEIWYCPWCGERIEVWRLRRSSDEAIRGSGLAGPEADST